MALRRGFKTEANSLGGDVRRELGLHALDRLDPFQLAEHLGIPVIGLSTLRANAPEAVDHLLHVEPEAFSATTVFAGRHRTVVYNDHHAVGRQNNSIVHETCHGLLFHEPCPAMDDLGCRRWNADTEDEATWLASVLLVPEDAALAVARGRWNSEPEAAEHFGVSDALLTWRLNMTGARRRVARAVNDGRRRRTRPA
jgi:Zn-dependent peptidase ImmA (M78 family)